MKTNEIIYSNRVKLRYVSILLVIVGGIISYLYYGTEPHETIGGFLCGFGLASFLIFLSLKKPQNQS
ncbi:hypothetical protein [Winogradskyella sp. UBA3174]|uniref:hypothetical protein n=1 Tax=Winogradskyella sp. UBA3174 TaxID=1947785 RepID=UPI0025DD2866|nr:hypothetical protein [Winogradskyella sp. UBA3174]